MKSWDRPQLKSKARAQQLKKHKSRRVNKTTGVIGRIARLIQGRHT